MDKPDLCPDEFYEIMKQCWQRNPDDRPLFSQLYRSVEYMLEQHADHGVSYLLLTADSLAPI